MLLKNRFKMKNKILFLFFVLFQLSFSQTKKDTLIAVPKHLAASNKSFSEKKFYESPESESADGGNYMQFDVTIPLRGNKTYGEIDANGNRSDYWFLPDGIGAKFGYGIHYNKWFGIAATSGIDWLGSDKLVAVPLYANFRLSPKVGEETRITLQYGFGKSFAIGRGDLMGTYKKFSLGLENTDGNCLFVEINNHGYKLRNNRDEVYSISIGIALVSF